MVISTGRSWNHPETQANGRLDSDIVRFIEYESRRFSLVKRARMKEIIAGIVAANVGDDVLQPAPADSRDGNPVGGAGVLPRDRSGRLGLGDAGVTQGEGFPWPFAGPPSWLRLALEPMPRLPEIPDQHVIDNAAKGAFEAALPPEFPRQVIATDDYGCDYLAMTRTGGSIDQHFYVQLKGSRDVHYVQDDRAVAQPLRVATTNYLLRQGQPVMIAVCDVAVGGAPIYWSWLEPLLKVEAARQPLWQEQATLTLHIPVANQLGPASRDAIVADVRRHYEEQATYAIAARTLLPDATRSRMRLAFTHLTARHAGFRAYR
jgi:uncharacterized protein DUF4365